MIQVDAKFLYYRLAKREAEIDTQVKEAAATLEKEKKIFDDKVDAYKKLPWFRKLLTQNPLSLNSPALIEYTGSEAAEMANEAVDWYRTYLPLRTICEHAILTGQKIDLPLQFAHILNWPAE